MMGELPKIPVPDGSLFFVCRYCVRMAEQWDRGAHVCERKDCGGPKKGLAYPQYNGMMTAYYMASHCVVCGLPAELQLQVEHSPRNIGICRKHLQAVGVTAEIPDQVPQDVGMVTKIEQVPVTLYEVIGIDPVKDLGFKE